MDQQTDGGHTDEKLKIFILKVLSTEILIISIYLLLTHRQMAHVKIDVNVEIFIQLINILSA